MKKLLALVFIMVSMTGIAHAAGCPAGQFADSAAICWPTQAQADAASASYTSANELTPAQQAASNAATPAASSVYTGAPAQGTSAQSGFTALAPIPGLTDQSATSVMNATTLANFFNNLYKYLIGLAAILAIVEIIWGGLEISTKDSVSKQSDGRERITQAIFGLVLVLSPVLVFSIINPNILNLSLNLPALDTLSAKNSAPTTDTTTITQQNNVDIGAAIAQAQQQCRDKGGTPVTDSGSIAGGTFKVTCDMTATAPVGTQITQQQCLNLIPKGTIFMGFTCSSEPASATSFQKAGSYTCSDLVGGGVCFHK